MVRAGCTPDLGGVPVRYNSKMDQAVLGAAYLAGYKSGVLESTGILKEKNAALQKVFYPQLSTVQRKKKCHSWLDAYEKARG